MPKWPMSSRAPLFCSIALAALHGAAVAQTAPIARAPAFRSAQLTELPRAGWLTNGGNLSNQRYSPLTADQPRQRREPARRVARISGGSGMGPRSANQAQPIVHEGIMYIVTGDNDAFAIDVDLGQVLWKYEAQRRPERGAALLRLGGARAWARRRQDLRRPARREARGARSAHGRSRLVDPSRGPEGRLQHHERAALLRRQSHHGFRRRRSRHSRPRQSVRREDGRAANGPSIPYPAPARSATRPGRRTATSGSTAALPFGKRRPSIPSSGSSISRRAIRGPC